MILISGLLSVFLIVAVSFLSIATQDRRVASVRIRQARAMLLSRSGLETATARLGRGQALFQAITAAGDGDWTYHGEDADADGTLDPGEDSGWGPGWGRLDRERLPVRFARRPSFASRSGGATLRTVRFEGRPAGCTGRLRGSVGVDSDLYGLRVEDHGAKIWLNGGLPSVAYAPPNDGAGGFTEDDWGGGFPYPYTAAMTAWPRSPYEVPDPQSAAPYDLPATWNYNFVLADVLNKLCRYLNRFDVSGTMVGKHAATALGPALTDRLGDVIVRQRPPGGYRTLDDFRARAGLTQQQFEQIRPYVTTIAVPDPTSVEPKHHWVTMPDPSVATITNAMVAYPYPRSPYVTARLQPRAPVNINRAETPVLVALMEGLTGTVIDYILEGGALAPHGAVVYATNPVSQEMARDIATRIVHYRTNQEPFDSTGEFLWFVDRYNPPGILHWNEIWDRSRSRMKVPGWNQNIFWQALDRETDLLYAKKEREFLQWIVKSNFSPNNLLNKFNPDHVVNATIDKSDLLRYSTEFSFRTTGVYEVDSLGWVADPIGADTTAAMSETVLRVFDRVVHTTQQDFDANHFPGDDYNRTDPLADVVSLPEPLYRGGSPAAFDGQIAPQHTGVVQAANPVALRQDFRGSIAPETGALETSNGGRDWMPGGDPSWTTDNPYPWNELVDADVLQRGDLFVHGGYISGHRNRWRTLDLTTRTNPASPLFNFADQGAVEFWIKIDHEFNWCDAPSFTAPGGPPAGDFPSWWQAIWGPWAGGMLWTDIRGFFTEQSANVLFTQQHTFPTAGGGGTYDLLHHIVSIRPDWRIPSNVNGWAGNLFAEALHVGNADAWRTAFPAPHNLPFKFHGDSHGPRPAGLGAHTNASPVATSLWPGWPTFTAAPGSNTVFQTPLDRWGNHEWHHIALQWREGNLLGFWVDGHDHSGGVSRSVSGMTYDMFMRVDPSIHRVGGEHNQVLSLTAYTPNGWWITGNGFAGWVGWAGMLPYGTFRSYRVYPTAPFGGSFVVDAYPAGTTTFRGRVSLSQVQAVAPEASGAVRVLAVGWEEMRPDRFTEDDGRDPGEIHVLSDRTAQRYADVWPSSFGGPLGANEVFQEAPDVDMGTRMGTSGPFTSHTGNGEARPLPDDALITTGVPLIYEARFDPRAISPVNVCPYLESVSVYFARRGVLSYRSVMEDE